ncbi:DUF1987 domain-containing protein [Tenuifilum thalassicum]|uniref:DUF1987 domain-containing protein n=1 Tax=Tenuifilum thalassicum TaxID=2590900 RepID=A0A7D3XF73_9BACT|nr:DUF1987 domain-containing protein [Tenuifilum thalassicum]QKG80872.1 DUF1987 domain-containing protein [Tenuifilum thalassicum]
MEPLQIAQTNTTPDVVFNPSENRFVISGYSRPENVRNFYMPILEWLESFAKQVEKKVSEGDKVEPIEFHFKLIYFNSSSAKFLYDIITLLNELKNKGLTVRICWFYDKEDVELLEAGQDLSELADVKFDFIAV